MKKVIKMTVFVLFPILLSALLALMKPEKAFAASKCCSMWVRPDPSMTNDVYMFEAVDQTSGSTVSYTIFGITNWSVGGGTMDYNWLKVGRNGRLRVTLKSETCCNYYSSPVHLANWYFFENYHDVHDGEGIWETEISDSGTLDTLMKYNGSSQSNTTYVWWNISLGTCALGGIYDCTDSTHTWGSRNIVYCDECH